MSGSFKGFEFFTIYSLSNLKTKLEVALSPTQSWFLAHFSPAEFLQDLEVPLFAYVADTLPEWQSPVDKK